LIDAVVGGRVYVYFAGSLIPRTWSIYDRMDTVTVGFRWAQTGSKFFFSFFLFFLSGASRCVVEWAGRCIGNSKAGTASQPGDLDRKRRMQE
jgi:hypothetical protein